MRYVGVGILVLFKQCVSVSMRIGFRVDLLWNSSGYGFTMSTDMACRYLGGRAQGYSRLAVCVYILSTYIRIVRSRLGVGMSLWFFPRRRRPAGFLVDLL